MMEEGLSWIFAFNLIVNSFLTFWTTALLLELFLRLFRIKHPRIKALAAALPFFKICLDLCLYRFSDWALLQGVNPLMAEVNTRQLSIMMYPLIGIEFHMQEGPTFTLADCIALAINPFWIQLLVCIAALGTLIAMALYWVRLFHQRRFALQLIEASEPFSLDDLKPSLSAWMKKKQIAMATSTTLSSPCLVQRTILFPSSLFNALTHEEREAIIAHETAHFYWKDGALRRFCSCVSSLFWWIPSRYQQKRMEELQEIAADQAIHRFGISPEALAQAVFKTAQNGKEPLLLTFSGRREQLKKRIERIFCKPMASCNKILCGLWIGSLFSILLGKLWIF